MSDNNQVRPSLRILLVDDEEVIHRGLAPYLRDLGHQVDDAYEGVSGLKMIEEGSYDLVLADVQMPRMDGLTLLEKIGEIKPDLATVIITAHGDMDLVIKALRLGAADFLTKPVKLAEVEAVIEKALRIRNFQRQERRLKDTISQVQSAAYQWRAEQRLVGVSEAMDQVREMIRAAVESGCDTVLIQGETGTGKEVVAREIHLLGKKEGSPFIAVSCPALPESLVESELFGHVKGSFTGAIADKAGCFEMADGGTLFLDEIADLSPAAQAKLLRVLETRAVRRIGGNREIQVKVNLIAATNAPLQELVSQKKFRQDLFFRLNVFAINIPPLRTRREDIMPLSEHFLEMYIRSRRLKVKGLTNKAQEVLKQYDYPGNVRELRNIIERAVILRKEEMIKPEHISLPSAAVNALSRPLASAEAGEKETLLAALEKAKWNRSRAAKDLKISYAALRYRMKKHDIPL